MANKTTYELALEIGGRIQSSLEKSVGGVNKKLDSIGKAAKSAAGIATAAFAAVKIGDFMKDAVSTYSDFNQSMANTSAIAGANAEEMDKLHDAALEMGKKTTKSATEAADALGYMALAGWDVDTSITALEPVLRLSEATSMDLATCSDLVTDSMSALGLTVDELSGYLDVTCKANNKSNQTAQQLMEAYIGCGGVLNNLGVDVKDSATALGVLANRGIKGSEAGTKLNTVLINLTSGTGQAGAMMKKLGISAFDSEGKFIGLQETLELVNRATKDLTEEERNAALAAIGGKTQIDTLNDLLAGLNTTTADGSTEWDALNKELYNAQGAMMDMAGKVIDTLPGAMAIFSSAVDDARIRLCEVFAPMAQEAIKGIADRIPNITENVVGFVESMYQKAVPAIQSFKDKAVANFAKVKPILDDIKNKGVAAFHFLAQTGKTAFQNIKTKIQENKPEIDKVIAVVLDLKDKLFEAFEKAKPTISYIATVALPAVVGAAMKVVGAASTVYQKLDEWGLLIPIAAGIAGAIAGIKMVKFAKDTMTTVKSVKALVTVFAAEKRAMLANIALKAKDKAETLYLHALYAKDAIVRGASTAATWAQTAAMTAWNALCTIGTAVTTALGAAFTFLTSPIGLIIIAIAAVIAIGVLLWKNWDTVKEKASQLAQWVSNAFNNLKEKASAAIQAFADKFPVAFAFISSVFDSFRQTVTNVFSGVKQVFQGFIQFFSGIFTGDWSKALDGLKNIFSGAFKALSSLALAPLNALKGVVAGAFNAIDTATGGKLTAIKEKASEAWSSIKEKAGTILSAAKDTISEKLNNIKSAYESHGGGIKGVAAAAMEGVKGYYTAGYSFLNNLTGGKLEEMRGKFSEKLSAVKQTAGNLMGQAVENARSNLENMKSAYTSAGGGIKGIAAATMEGVKTSYKAGYSFLNKLTGGKLEEVREKFSEKLSGVKQTVGNLMGQAVANARSNLENMKSAYTSAGGGIKGIAAATMEGVKTSYKAGYSFLNNLTGGKLEEMRGKFSEKLSAVKQTVGNLMGQAVESARSNLENMKTAYTNAGGGIRGIVVGTMAGVKGTVSNVMSAVNNLTGGKLDAIKEKFTSKLESVRSAVASKFEAIRSGISEKIEGAKTVVSNGLNAIKNFFSGVKLELPKIKTPHFKISGGEAPWGIMGKGTAPKVDIDWYKNGGILTGPTIFGQNGNSLLGGGEAGKEAVIPLSELWSNMRTVMSDVLGATQNGNSGAAAVYEGIRALTGKQGGNADQESITKQLYNNVTNNNTNTVNRTNQNNSSTDSSRYVYSPNVIIQGNANKEDVQQALDMSQEKFNKHMAEWQRQKGRTSFA